MSQIAYKRTCLALALMVAALTASRLQADETHHEGILMAAGGGRIVVASMDRLKARAFPLASLVKITRNRQASSVGDLSRGDLVDIGLETRLGQEFVVSIDVIATQ